MFDKVKAKHGFSLYDKAKDKISIDFLQSKVARLEGFNQDLERGNRELRNEIVELKSDLESKSLEYNRLISRDAALLGIRDIPNRYQENELNEITGKMEVVVN